MTSTKSTVLHDRILVGGRWQRPAGDEWIEVANPATEEVLGIIPQASSADADAAVAAAARAFADGPWPRMSPAQRADVLARVSDGIRTRADEFTDLYVRDQGGLRIAGPYMAHATTVILDDYVARARAMSCEPQERSSDAGRVLIVRQPVGPALAVVPWNGPLILTVGKVAPALLAGCPVIVKVSPETPLVSFPLAEIMAEAGLPEGVISFLPGGRELGRHLVANPAIRHISFTGSTATGQEVMRSAADSLARLTLELGGKSAAIVLDDLEPEDFLPIVPMACLGQSGQVCTTQSRILVPRRKHDAFRDALAAFFASLPVGDPADKNTAIGPLVSAAQRERTENYVAIARGEGAEVVTGGKRPDHLERGWFYEPTLVDGVANDMRIAREEVFGPVISLLCYDDDDDAVRIANDTDFGLGNGVHTKDIDRAVRLAAQLDSGTVSVNTSGCNMTEPWGGMKKSGLGREGGQEAIESYLEQKQIQLTPFPAN